MLTGFAGLEKLVVLGLSGLIFLPLGVWKLIEIVIWIFTNVKVTVQ